jgi:hypothetical protein
MLLKMLHCHNAQEHALHRLVTAEELSTYVTVRSK